MDGNSFKLLLGSQIASISSFICWASWWRSTIVDEDGKRSVTLPLGVFILLAMKVLDKTVGKFDRRKMNKAFVQFSIDDDADEVGKTFWWFWLYLGY